MRNWVTVSCQNINPYQHNCDSSTHNTHQFQPHTFTTIQLKTPSIHNTSTTVFVVFSCLYDTKTYCTALLSAKVPNWNTIKSSILKFLDGAVPILIWRTPSQTSKSFLSNFRALTHRIASCLKCFARAPPDLQQTPPESSAYRLSSLTLPSPQSSLLVCVVFSPLANHPVWCPPPPNLLLLSVCVCVCVLFACVIDPIQRRKPPRQVSDTPKKVKPKYIIRQKNHPKIGSAIFQQGGNSK